MIRAGIMSMQRIANYGSLLQAYALKKLLEEFGCEVEFVDYHVGTPVSGDTGRNSFWRKVKKLNEAFEVGLSFRQTMKYLSFKKNFQRNYWPLLGITEEKNYNPKLDLLVIGSDEVFNCLQDNPNVGFSPELFGKDNKAKILISYAASFGNATTDRMLNYDVLSKVQKWMKSNFDAISVRDSNSEDIVSKLGLKSVVHLDPVLTYDFKDEMETPFRKPDFRYLIVYGYTGRFSEDECEKIRNYANEKDLKIINIGGIQQCCDEFVDCSPRLILRWFMNAECVITDTFHGAILSIITERPFAVYIRTEGYGNYEKLSDLLGRLSLEDRAVTDDFREVLESDVDWKTVREIIKTYQISAKEYLAKWVKEAGL